MPISSVLNFAFGSHLFALLDVVSTLKMLDQLFGVDVSMPTTALFWFTYGVFSSLGKFSRFLVGADIGFLDLLFAEANLFLIWRNSIRLGHS